MLDAVVLLGPLCVVEVVERAHQVSGDAADALDRLVGGFVAERRIHNLATRGIALSPGQTIADVYAYRTPLYERCAHLTVPAGGQSLSETVEAVKTALARRNQR